MFLKSILISFFLVFSISLLSQERQSIEGSTGIVKLKDVFAHAKIEGNIRNYFMSTFNEGKLKDYYTNATGGEIGFRTPFVKGFRIGAKASLTYQTFSSDLNEIDSQSQRVSKWEHELYDINDYQNYNNLQRLEELYISYSFKKGVVIAGKMPVKETPLVNKSDGRMKPFAFSGVQLQLNVDSNTFFYGAIINRVAPRSTVDWYSFDKVIGIANNGNQPNGTKADYEGLTKSRGVSILGFSRKLGNSTVSINNYHLHRIMNTSMLEWRFLISKFDFNFQYILQFADNFQKLLDYTNRYIQPNEKGQVASFKSTYNMKHSSFSLSYTHLFATGRFLFPKELGRDQINTSISRSRAEGVGNSNIFTIDYQYYLNRHTVIKLEGTTVIQNEPDLLKYNKYGIYNYYQFNTRLNHKLKGFFDGLEISALYVFKENFEQHQPELIFNRSNFHQINLIANYRF